MDILVCHQLAGNSCPLETDHLAKSTHWSWQDTCVVVRGRI